MATRRLALAHALVSMIVDARPAVLIVDNYLTMIRVDGMCSDAG